MLSPVGCGSCFDPAQQHVAQAGGRQVRQMHARRHPKGICLGVKTEGAAGARASPQHVQHLNPCARHVADTELTTDL